LHFLAIVAVSYVLSRSKNDSKTDTKEVASKYEVSKTDAGWKEILTCSISDP
jgi:peptide-methionine (R)-S-oxide reductase